MNEVPRFQCHIYVEGARTEYAIRYWPFLPNVGDHIGLMRIEDAGGANEPEFAEVLHRQFRFTDEFRPDCYVVNLYVKWCSPEIVKRKPD